MTRVPYDDWPAIFDQNNAPDAPLSDEQKLELQRAREIAEQRRAEVQQEDGGIKSRWIAMFQVKLREVSGMRDEVALDFARRAWGRAYKQANGRTAAVELWARWERDSR